MKQFIGTKRLEAEPMTRGAYNNYRGWPWQPGEDPHEAGYLVEYVDGGKPNDPRHSGYISWSPADVFEQTYRELPAGIDHLQPHQQRVVIEKADHDDRLTKLERFLQSPTFETVDAEERIRLASQHEVMTDLSGILGDRIAAFTA